MQALARARSPVALPHDGPGVLHLALILSFPVTALDQFLRTTPAQFLAQPVAQTQHWVAGSLMTLPLFAAAAWAGGWIADRAGIGTASRQDLARRAVLAALLSAVALVPLWFERNKVDSQTHSQALVTPHSHGSVDLYWVGSGVIVALVCASLLPAAIWAGHGIAGRITAWLPRPGALARVPVLVLAVAAAAVLAWLLQRVASHAYASQVNNTSALSSVPVHSHAFFGPGHGPRTTAGPHATPVPFAFAYQLAHALQDGLAGQAAGLPAVLLAMAWWTWPHGRGRRLQSDT
jgi:hypothetical protein